ncbi:MAG: FtsQ-type POTRA domain-containing protein [Bacillota bacterium]
MRKGQPKRRARRTIKLLGLILGGLFVAFGILRSPVFSIAELEVSGCRILSPELVRAASQVQKGSNIWSINLAEVGERLKRDPRIAAVRVSRRLPDRLSIEVAEREPLAVLSYFTAYIEVSEDAVPIGVVQAATNRHLPLVSGISVGNLVIGQPIDDQRLSGALRVVRALDKPTREEISEIVIGGEGSITLYLRNGLRVIVGLPDAGLEYRLGLLTLALAEVRNQGLSADYIDLTSSRGFVVGLRKGS